MGASIHNFPPRPPATPTLHLVSTREADELTLTAQLLLACAPGRLDRLEASAATVKREGQPFMPVVIVHDRGLDLIASADAIRRIAIDVSAAGRQGAALDLMQASDQAEALSSRMQRSHH